MLKKITYYTYSSSERLENITSIILFSTGIFFAASLTENAASLVIANFQSSDKFNRVWEVTYIGILWKYCRFRRDGGMRYQRRESGEEGDYHFWLSSCSEDERGDRGETKVDFVLGPKSQPIRYPSVIHQSTCLG